MADMVQVHANILAYTNIFHQFHPEPHPTHAVYVPPFHAPPPPPQPELGLHPYTLVGNDKALHGLDNIAIILNKLLTVLYRAHLVHTALEPVHGDRNPVHPVHPVADVILVYEGLTAIHGALPHGAEPQVTHHKQAQQVPVARAVQAVCPDADTQSLAILEVPVSVNVPRTYIAYQAGSSIIPVLTVKLL